MRRDVSLPCRDVVMVWVELRLVSVGGHGGSRLCGCGQGTLMRDRPRAPFHPCLGTVPGATVAQRDRPRSRTCLDREGGQRPPSFGSAGPAVLPAPLCLRATRAPHRIGRHRTHPRVDTMASVYGHTGPCTGRASDGMIHGGHRPEEVGGARIPSARRRRRLRHCVCLPMDATTAVLDRDPGPAHWKFSKKKTRVGRPCSRTASAHNKRKKKKKRLGRPPQQTSSLALIKLPSASSWSTSAEARRLQTPTIGVAHTMTLSEPCLRTLYAPPPLLVSWVTVHRHCGRRTMDVTHRARCRSKKWRRSTHRALVCRCAPPAFSARWLPRGRTDEGAPRGCRRWLHEHFSHAWVRRWGLER